MDRNDELMTLARFGDERALGELVTRNSDMVVNYLTRLTGGRCDAEDLAQETFLRLVGSLKGYRNEGKFKGYLLRIATNTARNHMRKQQRRSMLFTLFSAEQASHGVVRTPQSQLLEDEAGRQLADAIAALPWQFRAALVLREIEELPYDTIAHVLRCSEGTVKSRISRGRSRLKKRLAPYLDGVDR